MSKEIIQFDQAMFETKLDAMVREKVERIVNAMPDASGGRDRQRREIREKRRKKGVQGRPLVVPERLRTLDHGRPWRDDQFAACRVSSSRDMSR